MLAINLGLELFPEKGRSAYIAFSRFFIGIASVVAPFFAGLVLSTFSSVRVVVAGALLDRYVIAFGVGAVITFACVIPLLLLGNRRI
jgi:MFS family permease